MLRLPANADLDAVYAFLTRQIRRWPYKLQFHVCRIRAAAALEKEALYAALLDLFWILGEKGQSLKQRMLEWSRRRLAPARLVALEECLAGRITAQQLLFSGYSVLHDGLWGQPLDWSFDAAEGKKDLLAVARLCLELGQLEQAKEILSEQLKVEPERQEIRHMLLEIYLAVQDAEGFKQSYLWLEANGCLDEVWRAASRRFEEAV
ncbi:MAG: hypothetical protein N3A55_06720 [Methylohalobius sp.]|nr:hypothetical protein [Methylohalobius sp.]